MINIPDNFPSYTSYNAKTLLLHVDTMKAALKELQTQVAALQASCTTCAPKEDFSVAAGVKKTKSNTLPI
jgi:hypothetical protein